MDDFSFGDNLFGTTPSRSFQPEELVYTVTDFIDVCNQTLAYSYSSIQIEGEVMSFKVNQGKWVFFDLKDDESSISCFMPVFKLNMPLTDGMRVRLRGYPKLTKWGRFSFTVERVVPVGEGNIKKSFEMLKQKLAKEGLFDSARKRPLPKDISSVGVISSTGAAGYADFCKIINARWGGLDIQVCHTQVQGIDAPEQIIRALKYLNTKADVDIIAIIRGGGSADDLSAFNDEQLVRSIAASRIPVITGIGHEVDESLADLVADIRASTPSNVAELLTKDRKSELSRIQNQVISIRQQVLREINSQQSQLNQKMVSINATLNNKISETINSLHSKQKQVRAMIQSKLQSMESQILAKKKIIQSLNPDLVLAHGYAIISGKIAPGQIIHLTTLRDDIVAEIKQVKERKTHDH